MYISHIGIIYQSREVFEVLQRDIFDICFPSHRIP